MKKDSPQFRNHLHNGHLGAVGMTRAGMNRIIDSPSVGNTARKIAFAIRELNEALDKELRRERLI